MTSVRRDRRRFLQGSLGAAGAFTLSQTLGCSSLERLFGVESGIYDKEVLIFGAGAAGLAAAYELKKRKIPYRVFEASARLGGRVQTLSHFQGADQFAELGAEFIDPRHTEVFDLAKELSLNLDIVPEPTGVSPQLIWMARQMIPREAVQKELQPLLTRLIRLRLEITGDVDKPESTFSLIAPSAVAAQYDGVTMEELINAQSEGTTARAKAYFKQACRVQFGCELHHLSALTLLQSLDPENRRGAMYRVRGGTEKLVRGLYDRVCGVLPDFFVRMNTRLTEIEERYDGFLCRMRTPAGETAVQAGLVILALPPAALRRVKGLDKLRIPSARREAIDGWQMGRHSKIVLGFQDRFWLQKQGEIPASNGTLTTDRVAQAVWDSSRGQTGPEGILSVTIAGRAGEVVGADTTDQVLLDLGEVWKKSRTSSNGKSAVQNWYRHESSGGSVTAYPPGFHLLWNKIFTDTDCGGRLIYAGEHASRVGSGTLQAALESGRRAAALAESAIVSARKS